MQSDRATVPPKTPAELTSQERTVNNNLSKVDRIAQTNIANDFGMALKKAIELVKLIAPI